MKPSSVITSTLWAVINAQSQSTTAHAPAGTNNMPACVTTCANRAARTAECARMDRPCICDNPKFMNAIQPCVDQTCSPEDHQASMVIFLEICGAIPSNSSAATHSGASSILSTPSATASATASSAGVKLAVHIAVIGMSILSAVLFGWALLV